MKPVEKNNLCDKMRSKRDFWSDTIKMSTIYLFTVWFELVTKQSMCQTETVLSISFEVDVPTGKVGGSLLFECRRRELSRGVRGLALPQKILKFRCLEMLFSTFYRLYMGLKNNQN